MIRKNIIYNQPLEKEIGFSRATRIGNIIAISGTAPISEDGSTCYPGDAYNQSIRCLEIIKDALEKANGRLEDVIRTRIYLKDITKWKVVAKAHGEYFLKIQPVCTFVEVKAFINPDWEVEIEADAVIDND